MTLIEFVDAHPGWSLIYLLVIVSTMLRLGRVSKPTLNDRSSDDE